MKKKLTAIFLCVALVAIAIVGASLAYFTDTDQATNTFAVGNVKIELIEQQRGENGLVPFEQNKKLYPIVGSAQGDKDEYGMPIAKNYVDKMVTIKNTGSEKAYIRAYFAIPSAILVTVVLGITPLRFSKGLVFSSSAHSCTAISTPPVVMTLCALPSAVKNAMVPAANVAMQMASTDRIKIFRFIVLTPLKLYLQTSAPGFDNEVAWSCQTI